MIGRSVGRERLEFVPAIGFLGLRETRRHLFLKPAWALRPSCCARVRCANPSPETLGCYQFKLAQILAAQRRFAEAGVRSYAVFHHPPDEFLKARQDEAVLMREYMERERVAR